MKFTIIILLILQSHILAEDYTQSELNEQIEIEKIEKIKEIREIYSNSKYKTIITPIEHFCYKLDILKNNDPYELYGSMYEYESSRCFIDNLNLIILIKKNYPAYKINNIISKKDQICIELANNKNNDFIKITKNLDDLITNMKFKNMHKIEMLEFIKKILVESGNTFATKFFKNIISIIDIIPQTLTQYNDIAYYLQKAGANKEAVYLLKKIVAKFPNRTVAYINLGDAYWALGEKEKAKKAYTTYIEQMCNKGLQKKIPQKVLKRVEKKDVCK